METNLANVYAYLKKTFTDTDFMYNYPPSYLKTLTGDDKKIILACKMDESKLNLNNYLSPKKIKSLKIKVENPNLTGSPLKDECEIDTIDMSFDLKNSTPWLPNEKAYISIPVDKARSIMCDYDFQNHRNNSNGSIWFLCDASDVGRTIFLHFDFVKGFNSRGIVRYNGIIPAHEVNSADLIQKHLSIFKNATAVKSLIENCYNIKQSNIWIKLFWSSSLMTPSLTNFKNCKVTLHHSLHIDDGSFITNDFLNQLKFLSIIKDNIIAYKESYEEKNEPIYNGIGIEGIQDKIITIMTDHSGLYNYRETPITGDFEIESVVERSKIRLTMDLTDKLWETLKCCSSYRELKLAFSYVFQSAAKYNIVNMPTNKNRLAELICEVSQRRLAIPCLTGSEPLELLLEIGLEKLLKDYEYIFTESKMCRVDDFNIWRTTGSFENIDSITIVRKSNHKTSVRDSTMPTMARKTLLHSKKVSEENNKELLGINNSNFDQKEIDRNLSKLLQLHLTLEHLMVIQNYLNLKNANNELCFHLLEKPIRSFNNVIDSRVDKIEIPLPIDSVVHNLESEEPSSRKIIFKSKNNLREVESTFQFSMENIFPPDIFKGPTYDEKEITLEKSYYCWNYSKILTKNS